MNKETVTSILTGKQISLEDLSQFVIDYTKEKLGKEITAQEISGIVMLIQNRTFSLRYAATEAARILNLYVMDAVDKNGRIIATFVYE